MLYYGYLGADMKYTLITKQGRVMQFYVKAMAELYQVTEGGVVITQQILEETVDTPVE
jgi:hypothetical protein